MLFHEIYGAYFQTVCRILRKAAGDGIAEKRMLEIVSENAFVESIMVIPEKLKSGEWPLLKERDNQSDARRSYSSVLSNAPVRPMTLLEKQWLKSLLDDPRLQLFIYREEDQNAFGELQRMLEDIPPLYDRDTFEYYDRYSDGDDYTDPDYILHFHRILQALHEKRMVYLEYTGRYGKTMGKLHCPYRVEYSSKDDKFRILCRSVKGTPYTINVSRIKLCVIRRPARPEEMVFPEPRKTHVDLILTDERNALQRAMLHFSDLQKETERVGEKRYRIRLYYNRDDETEIVIRILAFGPLLRVAGPPKFIGLIKERIEKQENLCGL